MKVFSSSRRLLLIGCCVAAVLILAACGGSGSSGGTTSSSGASVSSSSANTDTGSGVDTGSGASDTTDASGTASPEAVAALEAGYKGAYTPPPADSPTPQPGKNVWSIPFGRLGVGAHASDAAAEAGKAMGWNVTQCDGKFQTSAQLNCIRQAIADKADGIFTYIVDCPAIKAGLQEARDAGIKVVTGESLDCSQYEEGQPSLYDNIVAYNKSDGSGVENYIDWIKEWGAAQAPPMVVATGGNAKIIDFVETDAQTTLLADVGFRDEIKRICPNCEIVETVEFVGGDIGPPLQQKASAALLAHPEANAILGSYDGPVVGAIGPAVKQAGRSDTIFVEGGEGSAAGIEALRAKNEFDAGVGTPVEWEAYASMDALNRLFNGETPPPTGFPSGISAQIFDREHNLPPEGEPYQSPIDFRAAYLKAWGVG